jgi:hypothetical protein
MKIGLPKTICSTPTAYDLLCRRALRSVDRGFDFCGNYSVFRFVLLMVAAFLH